MESLTDLLKEMRPVKQGMKLTDVVTAKWINAMQTAIQMLATGKNVATGGTILKTSMGGGYSLFGRGVDESSGGTAGSSFPFEVTAGTGTSVYVNYGTLNNLVPDNPKTAISVSTGYVGLEVTSTDGRQITALTCAQVGTTSPPPPPSCVLEHAPTSFKIPLAHVTVSGGSVTSISQIWNCNLIAQVTLCAQVEKGTVVIGTSPWDNYFTWSVGAELNVSA